MSNRVNEHRIAQVIGMGYLEHPDAYTQAFVWRWISRCCAGWKMTPFEVITKAAKEKETLITNSVYNLFALITDAVDSGKATFLREFADAIEAKGFDRLRFTIGMELSVPKGGGSIPPDDKLDEQVNFPTAAELQDRLKNVHGLNIVDRHLRRVVKEMGYKLGGKRGRPRNSDTKR